MFYFSVSYCDPNTQEHIGGGKVDLDSWFQKLSLVLGWATPGLWSEVRQHLLADRHGGGSILGGQAAVGRARAPGKAVLWGLPQRHLAMTPLPAVPASSAQS